MVKQGKNEIIKSNYNLIKDVVHCFIDKGRC
jgi:hypothetical protein